MDHSDNETIFYLVDIVTNTRLAPSRHISALQQIRDSFLTTQKKNLGVCYPDRYQIRRGLQHGE